MVWLFITIGGVALLMLIGARRLRVRRGEGIDPATYQAMTHLYAIRRRLDVALFKLRLSEDMAEARRRLNKELEQLNAERPPES